MPCFCLSCASFANWGATFILINIIWGVPAPHFGINKPKLHPFSKICTLFIHVFPFSPSRCRSTEGFVFLSETQTMLPSDTEGFRIRDWLIMKGNAGMGNAKTTIICLHYPQYHKWSRESHSDGTSFYSCMYQDHIHVFHSCREGQTWVMSKLIFRDKISRKAFSIDQFVCFNCLQLFLLLPHVFLWWPRPWHDLSEFCKR